MKSKKITLGLLIFYLIVLTWIIVFKMQFAFSGDLPELRSINLIPFGGSLIVNGEISFSEIIKNALAFIPFGILISVLWDQKTFIKKLLPIILTSFIFETLQFVFGIGASDITDIISNSIGGAIGIAITVGISKIFKNNWKKIINVISLIGCIILTLFIAILIFANL